MGDRKRRKKNKLRGQRTMGAGGTKNRRGAGCRGGRGNAGANKHRFHSIGRLKPRKYRLKAAPKGREINLGDLSAKMEMLAAKGKVTKEGDRFVVEKASGYTKVLGEGETDKKIVLRINASEKAIRKILAKGGKFEYAKKGYEAGEAEAVPSEEDEDLEFESAEAEEGEDPSKK